MIKYLQFVLIDRKPKTNVYDVINKRKDRSIGVVKWYTSWRQYCFFPETKTVFHKDCLIEITEFILKLMEERKKGD